MDKFIKYSFFLIIILFFSSLNFCYATDYHPARVNNTLKPGAPWEPIYIENRIIDEERTIKNVTIYYSFNNTDIWHKDFMSLKENNVTQGIWFYTIPKQPNGTTILYYDQIFFTNGDILPHTITESSIEMWKIYMPKSKMRVYFFNIEKINHMELTADVKVSIELWEPFDFDFREVRLKSYNQFGSPIDFRILKIPKSSSRRFHYVTQMSIEDLWLSGKDYKFPFDNYTLTLEFSGFDMEKADIEIYNINLNYQDSFTWANSWKSEISENNDIIISTNILRRPEARNWFTLPLNVFILVLAASFLIEVKNLSFRLRLFIGSIFYLFTFAFRIQDYVPYRIVGFSFAEIFIPYLALFSTSYLIFSILNYRVYDRYKIRYEDNPLKLYAYGVAIDFISIVIPLVYLFEVVIKNSYQLSLKLINIMPTSLFYILILLPIGALLSRVILFLSHFRSTRARLDLVNKYLIAGGVLTIIQYLIFYFGFDYLITFGPYVTHHFVELPAILLITYGISVLFDTLKIDRKKGELLIIASYLGLVYFQYSRGRGLGDIFQVTWPYLIGLFVHRILNARAPGLVE